MNKRTSRMAPPFKLQKSSTWTPGIKNNVRNSIYHAAEAGFNVLAAPTQYDTQGGYEEDENSVSRTRTNDNAQPFNNDSPRDSLSGKKVPVVVDLQEVPLAKPEAPYHVMNKQAKWLLIVIIGIAGLFSGLSSNIYFPALDKIAQELNVSAGTVSLTITSYLVIQGISPIIWGSFSDTLGRRPIYLASFTVYIIANIGLSFSPNFPVLLIFRGLQAAGSASTVSIGNGVIQDISPPSERGAFISFYQAIRNFSIAVGPVIGGVLSNFLGFRSIFVFLVILSSLTIIMIFFCLPETLRSIAGNGSLRLKGIYRPFIYVLGKEPSYMQDPVEPIVRKKVTLATFVEPLSLLLEKDILFNLLFGGTVYTIWSMVTSSTTFLFKASFGLNELLVGFAFLPNGIGTIVGSAIIGNLMTKDFKSAEAGYRRDQNLPDTYKLPVKNLPSDFPVELARLKRLPWVSVLFFISVGTYGFTFSPAVVSRPGWIVVPLILQFMIAATSNAVFALNQTLISDLCPGKGASSTALNNIVRCGLGAFGVAFGDLMISSFGPGATYLGLALLLVVISPLVAINWVWGPEWRIARATRKAQHDAEEARRKAENGKIQVV